jgi:hypothetical protein
VKLAIRLSVCILGLCAAAPSSAAGIEVGTGDCRSGVHLVAREARLTDVLARLADALKFDLQIDGNTDSIVDLDVSMQPAQLVAKMSSVDSIMVTQSRDPQCPGQYRIEKVWLLPKSGVARTAAVAPSRPPQQDTRRLDEMSRQAKEAYQVYTQTHGKPPPGVPEEIGDPK